MPMTATSTYSPIDAAIQSDWNENDPVITVAMPASSATMYDGLAIRRSRTRMLSIVQTSRAESRPALEYQNWYVAFAPTAEMTARMWMSLKTCQICMARIVPSIAARRLASGIMAA